MNAKPQLLTISYIQEVVAEHYRLRLDQIRSRRRTRNMARPRQVAMYLACTLLPMRSFPEIGRVFNRDHTTVMYAVKRVGDLMARDPRLAADVATLRETILVSASPDLGREMTVRMATEAASALRIALTCAANADPAAFAAKVFEIAGIFPEQSR